MRAAVNFLLLMFLSAASVYAAVEVHKFDTEKQQQQYKKMIDELRCLVCQNQNLADSNAELALDLRNKVASMIQQGKTNQEIVDYMVARYGDFVLYRPPFKAQTLLLWVGPFVILLFGLYVLLAYVRKQKTKPVAQASEAELSKVRKLLDDEEDK